jgi:hypothetical protein
MIEAIVTLFIIVIIQFYLIDKLMKEIIFCQKSLLKQDKINKEIIELLTRNMEQLGLFLTGKI